MIRSLSLLLIAACLISCQSQHPQQAKGTTAQPATMPQESSSDLTRDVADAQPVLDKDGSRTGDFYTFAVPERALYRCPRWKKNAPCPPLSPRKAERAALTE